MHDVLLARSPKLDRTSLLGYAQELGLEMKSFTKALDSMQHSAKIERDKELAISLDIYNTPTFFINGRMVIGNRPYEYMKRIIAEEIQNAESPGSR